MDVTVRKISQLFSVASDSVLDLKVFSTLSLLHSSSLSELARLATTPG